MCVCVSSIPDESILLDLKHLLIEAKQKIPPFLAAVISENDLSIGGEYFLLSPYATLITNILVQK